MVFPSILYAAQGAGAGTTHSAAVEPKLMLVIKIHSIYTRCI